jgi:hypothetical protein
MALPSPQTIRRELDLARWLCNSIEASYQTVHEDVAFVRSWHGSDEEYVNTGRYVADPTGETIVNPIRNRHHNQAQRATQLMRQALRELAKARDALAEASDELADVLTQV